MTSHIPQCQSEIQDCNNKNTDEVCDNAYSFCMDWEVEPVTITGVNPYDLRVQCGPEPLCYNFTNVGIWLNNKTVQNELGVSRTWNSCNNMVNARMEPDWMHDFQEKVPVLLENQVRGLIYAGDQDFICNWLGNQAWALALNWTYSQAFNSAPVTEWHTYGKMRTSHGFTFLQVFNAGHMVPMNQPQAAQTMVKEFLSGSWS